MSDILKRRGFTLVELLAVITILSIILLIAVPIVSGIVKDSKEKTRRQSVELYGRAIENAVSNYFMNNPGEEEVTLEQLEQGNYIQYKEPKVECNIARIIDREVYLSDCKVGNKYVDASYGENLGKLETDADNDGKISVGDKYSYKVNDTDTFNFYVLSINSDNTVNLIMDRNICNDGTIPTSSNLCLIAWYDDGDDPANYNNDTNEFGPVTAMQGLYNATKNWKNVRDMDLSENNKYSDEGNIENSSYGYGEIITTELGIKITKKDKTTEVTREGNLTPVIPYEEGKKLKARLPKLEEVYNTDATDTTHCHGSEESCPAWLTNGLEQYFSYYLNNDHILGIKGYWTLSTTPSSNTNGAYSIEKGGHRASYFTSSAGSLGLRPVITVPKTDLS